MSYPLPAELSVCYFRSAIIRFCMELRSYNYCQKLYLLFLKLFSFQTIRILAFGPCAGKNSANSFNIHSFRGWLAELSQQISQHCFGWQHDNGEITFKVDFRKLYMCGQRGLQKLYVIMNKYKGPAHRAIPSTFSASDDGFFSSSGRSGLRTRSVTATSHRLAVFQRRMPESCEQKGFGHFIPNPYYRDHGTLQSVNVPHLPMLCGLSDFFFGSFALDIK